MPNYGYSVLLLYSQRSPKNTSTGLLLTYDDKIVLLSEILELRRALLRISNFLVILPHQLYNIRSKSTSSGRPKNISLYRETKKNQFFKDLTEEQWEESGVNGVGE